MTVKELMEKGLSERQANILAKNGRYWEERFALLEQSQNKKAADCYADIERQYRLAEKNLEGQISVWYQRFADNNQISLADARKLLAGKELEEFKWDVNDYIRHGEENALTGQWVKQLENASARYHVSRLDALKIQCQQQTELLFGNQLDVIDATMRDIYTDGYYRTAYEIQKGVGVGWNFTTIDENKISKVINKPWAVDGKNFSSRIWENRQKMVGELHAALTQGIITGQDPRKTIDIIKKKLNVSRSVAGRLVMTEGAFFSSAAQKDSYMEMDVEQYQISATLDSATSEICRELDGMIFQMSQWDVGVTAPPFHPNCRTTTVPYDEDFAGIGERAARDKDGNTYYVPADMTYRQWEKSFVDGNKSGLGLRKIKSSDTIDIETKVLPEAKILRKTEALPETVEEIQELMRNQGWFNIQEIAGVTYDTNKTVNLIGVDAECAREIYLTHKRLFDKYPQLIGKLNSVTSAKRDSGVYAECFFGQGHGGIIVNTNYFSSHDKLLKDYADGVAQKINVANTNGYDVVMHELGHAVDDYLTYTELAAGTTPNWKPKIVSSFLKPKVMRACGLKKDDIKQQLSEYAEKNAQEWFAECFMEYMCSPSPRPMAVELGKQLDEIVKGVR